MNISFISRKTNVLSPSSLDCFRKKIITINSTQGCTHQCVYCYARGYLFYPGDQNIVVYDNLIEKLRQELPRKRKLPEMAFFSTSCDAFQPVPNVLKITYNIMEILLEHGIAVSFLTKGTIPHNFLKLFETHKHLVHAKIGLITTSRKIQQTLEPYASSPQLRLNNISELIKRGINTEVRMDPIIPGLTDSCNQLNVYCKAMKDYDVKSIVLNYLLLRNMIKKNLKNALSATCFNKIIALYKSGKKMALKAPNSRALVLDTVYRKRSYEKISNIAGSYNINTYVCGCKNLDIANNMICSKTARN